jgi:hypothetical protein
MVTEEFFQYSEHAVLVASRLINSLIFCIILLVPIILLYFFSASGPRLGILVATVTGVSILTMQLTEAKVWEAHAVTAA